MSLCINRPPQLHEKETLSATAFVLTEFMIFLQVCFQFTEILI